MNTVQNGKSHTVSTRVSVDVGMGMLALLSGVIVAFGIYLVQQRMGHAERGVLFTGIFLGGLSLAALAVYLVRRRRSAQPAELGLLLIVMVSVLLVGIYLYWVSFYVFFPADILIWSESDFVNDILKFRVGYPLYTAQENNESFTYMPGTQLLTYGLASLVGQGASVPTYRIVQVLYTLLAAVVAVLCCRLVLDLSMPAHRLRDRRLHALIWLPALFLIATNSLTNPFTHNLHNDALAQLLSVVAYYLLLRYIRSRDIWLLAPMALVPTLGLLVKQSLIIWAVFYGVHLLLFDRPRSIRRAVGFAIPTAGMMGIAMGVCYLLWGEHFTYWVFSVLGQHGVSPLRAVQHLLDTWVYLFIGLAGGVVLLRNRALPTLLSPWLVWLALMLLSIYTSGVAWMLNHIGPACLIAGIWFLAAFARVWPLFTRALVRSSPSQAWLRAGVMTALVLLMLNGLHLVRIPTPPLSEDAYRYIEAIENEFDGEDARKILLDMGTWVYFDEGVIMRDRAPSIGERGYSQTGDFSGIIRRLEARQYSKILVRNLHSREFWYDHPMWSKPSGIKQALLRNYHEVDAIPGVVDQQTYGLSKISVLKPLPMQGASEEAYSHTPRSIRETSQ